MNETSLTNVQIRADNDTDARRWAERLSGEDQLRISTRDEEPADVILMVGDCQRDEKPPETDNVGVLRVGGRRRADVKLPADASPREVGLACRLLAEIVRLRRQLRAGDEARRELSQSALTDHLTGLPNRRAWEKALARIRRDTAALGPSSVVAIFDLDHFKRINDQLGHDAGDRVLRAAGSALRDSLREDDVVARIGGDEFAVMLAGKRTEAAVSAIERARRAVVARTAAVASPAVTASAGYCVWKNDAGTGLTSTQLIARADEALREAKRGGRDQSRGFGTESDEVNA